MGYECPVCSIPQADESHLANHLAFRAMVHSDDHETYLEETVPEWGSMGEDELGAELSTVVATTEFPQVFEDTTPNHDHDHDHAIEPSMVSGGETLDAQAQAVLEEARELTRERDQS